MLSNKNINITVRHTKKKGKVITVIRMEKSIYQSRIVSQ